MEKDSSHNYSQEEPSGSEKSPRSSSIHFIKQFARVYSTTHGGEFSYLILN